MPGIGPDIAAALHEVGIDHRPVCVHSSLRSFTRAAVRADDFVDAFLQASCTVLVPTFSPRFATPPPAGHRPLPFNSEDDGSIPARPALPGHHYTPQSSEIDAAMGAVPAAVLARPGRRRGTHPLSSFAAVGCGADALIHGQSADDVFAPLRALADQGGAVVLAGVDLSTATILHLAEEQAGLRLLVRWALDPAGQVRPARHGGCSRGFPRLSPRLAHLRRGCRVAGSQWQIFDAAALLSTATRVMAAEPNSAICAEPTCHRCRDSVAQLRT